MEATKNAPQSGQQQAGKVVSAGKSSPVVFNNKPADAGGEGEGGKGDEGLTEEQKAAAAAASAGAGAGTELTDEQKAEAEKLKNLTPEQLAAIEAEKNKLPEINDDQLKKLLESKGITLDDKGFEGLKEKLNKPAETAKSPEDIAKEKEAQESAFEKRMLDHFIANGGTAENFVALKKIASADLKELSESEVKRELKDNGFTDEEIATVLKERYYQINPEELEQDEDESEEDFKKRKALIEKKIAFGAKKIESKSSHIKKQASDALAALREAIKTEDSLVEDEVKLSSKVDELAPTLPRKMTFQLGKVNDQEIAPVEYDVTEDDIAEVVATLKDTGKRNNILYNKDGDLNLESVSALLLKNKILESALKATYLEGGNRQIAIFEKTFPGRTAKDIGVGGTNGGNTGKPGKI
ncbi:MAG: hypothetical protein KBA90_13905, partial [Chitinophagaceae bacterium]|nr:hypothetical protein [Chitinophagaceae bacterium]